MTAQTLTPRSTNDATIIGVSAVEVESMANLNDTFLRGRINRRIVLKSATGAAAGMYAFGVAG